MSQVYWGGCSANVCSFLTGGSTLYAYAHPAAGPPEAAADMGVADKEIVSVKIDSDSGRSAILGDVVVRVSEKFAPAMHIDTDEANAVFNASREVWGEIVK